MPTFLFNKLIRDKILTLHLENGHEVVYKKVNGVELKKYLTQKLHEEADEIPVSDEKTNEVIEEIADVQQIINDLKLQYGISDEELEAVRQVKFDKKGGFETGNYIETVTLPEDDKWATYYRNSPEKYLEVGKDILDIITIPEIETGTYEHYKGKRYEVLGVALYEENLLPVVVYKPLYETRAPLWVRPYDMFVGYVDIDGKQVKRFVKL